MKKGNNTTTPIDGIRKMLAGAGKSSVSSTSPTLLSSTEVHELLKNQHYDKLEELVRGHFDRWPRDGTSASKFLNCVSVQLHSNDVKSEDARLLCSLSIVALHAASEGAAMKIKMDTKTAEKIATNCYRYILSRDVFCTCLE